MINLALLMLWLLASIVASSRTHAAERLLQFYAYLADEINNHPGSYTIAPGCGLAMLGNANGRCSFNQFLEYTWKQDRLSADGKTVEGYKNYGSAPKVGVLKAKENFSAMTAEQLFNKLMMWREQGTKKSVLGMNDWTKVVPGAADYYDALGKLGNPIGQLSSISESQMTSAMRDIVQKGRLVAGYLFQARKADVEKYRIGYFKTMLPKRGLTLQIKAGEPHSLTLDPNEGEQVGSSLPKWNRLDLPAIAKISSANGHIDGKEAWKRLLAISNDYRNGVETENPATVKDHYRAIDGARTAQTAASCY